MTETISLVSGPAPVTVENSSRELTSSPMRSAACVARATQSLAFGPRLSPYSLPRSSM